MPDASETGPPKLSRQASGDGMDLDDLLPQVGEFGRYQKMLVWFVCLPACIPCAFGAFNQLFMSDTPAHWCKVTALGNLTQEERKVLAIPLEEGGNGTYSSCKRYNVDWTEILSLIPLEDLSPNSSWPVESCLEGWEYASVGFATSIVEDFDLVCDKDIYPTIGLAALNTGGPIGVYFFGRLNDRVGRKSSYFCCLLTLIIGGILTAVAQDFWQWAGSRVLVGLTVPAVYQIPFIIALELVGPNYRSFITVLTCLAYTFGLIILAAITYFLRDWRLLALSTSTPFLLFGLYWFYLPESPRWLLAKGKLEEANKILDSLAKANGKELPDSFKLKLKQRMMLHRTKSELDRIKSGPGTMALWSTPNMRLKTALITLNWFANEMVYVGLSYYGPALGTEEHLSFFLSSIVEVPSYMFCWAIMDRWGRRWPLCLFMLISGVSCIITVLLPQDASVLTLVLFLCSKFTISASFLIIYPFAGELYPTQLRGVGIGFSAYVGGLGLIIIPFVTYLGRDNLILPLLIMGVVSVIGGFSSLRLPETLHQRLPQTVEEGEEFGKDFGWTDCLRCIPLRPTSKASSYEDLDEHLELQTSHEAEDRLEELLELRPQSARPPLRRKASRMVRQASVMETNLDGSGAMQMTYWF